MSFTNRNLKFRGCVGRSFLASVTVALLLNAATAQAATIIVASGNDSGVGTLRQAILDSSSGGTISFAAGITTVILTSGVLVIDKNLTINGPGSNLLTVQRSASARFRIFDITATSTATISGLKISGGSTPSIPQTRGGGISCLGTLTISNCAISGNRAAVGLGGDVNSGYGGGLYNAGSLTIINSTVSGNSAAYSAGGLENWGSATIISSTISGNSCGDATSGATGGGINNIGTLTITGSTVSGNSAVSAFAGGGTGSGGGIYNHTIGVASARNTIIALNTSTSGPDVHGALTSQNFNLIGNNAGATITPAQSSDQIGTAGSPINPLLGPLQDNGGPTQTMALMIGSIAIDKGQSSGSTTDQRGFTRPVGVASVNGGDGSDIGAFEVQAPPTPTALGNISTRMRVETGDNVLIGGFIVTGTQSKKVIVRAIGPSLPVPGKLANPTLELHGPSGLIMSNDNWMDAPNRQEIIDSTIAPTNDLESAILTTLPANGTGYTAIVRGAGGGTGVGLVEVYDLDRTANSNLANIASRGFVQTNDNVMIGGFILTGTGTRKVIVRAIGPSLPVPGALGDPTLELYNSSGMVIASNDNWRSNQEAEILASGLAPTNNLESTVVATLPAAAHTAILRGKNQTTGVALVEVFALP